MEIKVKYNWWETVYIKTDVDQMPGLITGYEIKPRSIRYWVSRDGNESLFYEQELNSVPSYLRTSDN